MTRPQTRRAFLLFVLVLLACGKATIVSPIARVDLRAQLPPALQRKIVALDTTFECRKRLLLEGEGVKLGVVATFRILDEGTKHITSVEVAPNGPVVGGVDAEASAVVGEIEMVRAGGAEGAARVPVFLTLSARKGCSRVEVSRRILLAADDPICKPKKGARLLVPVP
jgi:hypothetical protein